MLPTQGQTFTPDADTACIGLPAQELSRFESAFFFHLIDEKIDGLFRNLEFGRNPGRLQRPILA
jgi:hypothetical protein